MLLTSVFVAVVYFIGSAEPFGADSDFEMQINYMLATAGRPE